MTVTRVGSEGTTRRCRLRYTCDVGDRLRRPSTCPTTRRSTSRTLHAAQVQGRAGDQHGNANTHPDGYDGTTHLRRELLSPRSTAAKGTPTSRGLKGRVTLAAQNNVVVTNDLLLVNSAAAGATPTGSDMPGLVASNSVVNYHPVNSSWQRHDDHQRPVDLHVDPDAPAQLLGGVPRPQGQARHLHVRCSIAQSGAESSAGGASGTGYLKDYSYDTRLTFASPPHFPQWTQRGVGRQDDLELKPAYWRPWAAVPVRWPSDRCEPSWPAVLTRCLRFGPARPVRRIVPERGDLPRAEPRESVVRPRSRCPGCGTRWPGTTTSQWSAGWCCGALSHLRTADQRPLPGRRSSHGCGVRPFARRLRGCGCSRIPLPRRGGHRAGCHRHRRKRLPDGIVQPSYAVAAEVLGGRAGRPGLARSRGRSPSGGACPVSLLPACWPSSTRKAWAGGTSRVAGVLGMYLGWLELGTLLVGGFLGFLLGGPHRARARCWQGGPAGRPIPYGPYMICGTFLAVFWGRLLRLVPQNSRSLTLASSCFGTAGPKSGQKTQGRPFPRPILPLTP